MRKKDTAGTGGSEWGSAPSGPITPLDVQQKEFQVARFGAGYRMREVDEFLDQVTDALTALTAENERLRRGGGDPAPAPGAPSARRTAGEDRADVDAFIRREKGFLQDLGGLVQAHAEELRSMVRAARRDVAPPPVDELATEEPRGGPTAGVPEPSETVPEETLEVRAGPSDPSPAEASTGSDEVEVVQEPAAGDDDATGPSEAPTATEAGADEPIRLEEPQPARSKRSDEEEGGSLRELFWGEE